MRTSIRLALMSLLISGITFAASGAPLPFQAEPAPAHLELAASLVPH